MSITDIANGLVELCKEGKFEEAINAYYAESIRSVCQWEPVRGAVSAGCDQQGGGQADDNGRDRNIYYRR